VSVVRPTDGGRSRTQNARSLAAERIGAAVGVRCWSCDGRAMARGCPETEAVGRPLVPRSADMARTCRGTVRHCGQVVTSSVRAWPRRDAANTRMSPMADYEMPIPSGLEASDQLSLSIGRVCREDVSLEQSCRQVFLALVGAGLGLYLRPASIEQLIDGCRLMLSNSGVSDRWQTAGDDALIAAKAAHKERNRVVHDMLLPAGQGDDDLSSWNVHQAQKKTLSFKATPKALTDVARTLNRLSRANQRVSNLGFGMVSLVLPPGGGPELADDVTLSIVEDNFDLIANGGARPHGSTE
jgi:hypothetical protein